MDILSTSSITSLVNKSKQSEYNNRITPLLTRQTKFSNLSSKWGSLKTKLTSLRSLLSSLKDVNSSGSFAAKTVDLSLSDYFTATAESTAALSSYSLRINQLAQNDRAMSDTVTSSDLAGLSAGTYTFQVSSGETNQNIDITLTGSETKQELMEAIAEGINEAMDNAVHAAVFSPTSGVSKLSVTSNESGQDFAITIQDVTGSVLDSIGMNFTSRTALIDDGTGGYVNTLDELNSKLTLNNVSIERGSNTIDDLISGVTITLKDAMAEGIPTINVIVKNNKDSIKSNLDDFISKFNESYQFIKDNYYSDKDGNRGIFVGNATAIGLMQQFSSVSYQKVSGLPDGDYSYLADIGITFDTSTGLSISDSDKLDTAMESNPDQIAALFNSDNGIANQLYDLVDSYTSTDGTISNLIDSYDNSVSYLKDKVSQRQTEIDRHAEVLRNQYQQMQMQLSSLYDMQSNLSSLGLLG